MDFRKYRLVLWVSVFVSALVGVGFFLALESVRHPEVHALENINLASTVASALLAMSAAGLFASGLKNFKSGLRKAYILLCIGIVTYGIAQAQMSFVALTNGWWWLDSGIGLVMYFFPVVFVFLGARKFTKLLGVHTRWASTSLAIGVAVLLSAVMPFLSYAPKDVSNFEVGIATAVAVWDGVFYMFAAGAVWRVKKVIGPTYVKAMSRLYLAMFVTALAVLHFIAVQFLVPLGNWYYNDEMTMIPQLFGVTLMLAAGYSVATFSSRQTALAEAKAQQSRQIMDAITYAASLASKPEEVETIVDDLRMITAKKEPGKKLSTKDEEALVGVYHRIQEYLAAKDPLRVFTVDSLHEDVTRGAKLSHNTAARLWPTAPASH